MQFYNLIVRFSKFTLNINIYDEFVGFLSKLIWWEILFKKKLSKGREWERGVWRKEKTNIWVFNFRFPQNNVVLGWAKGQKQYSFNFNTAGQ